MGIGTRLVVAAVLAGYAQAQAAEIDAPYQWVEFCKREGVRDGDPLCVPGGVSNGASEPPHFFDTLRKVNDEFNRYFFVRDSLKYGRDDFWTARLGEGVGFTSRGDCDDFALSKRRRLLELGVPASLLEVAIVRTHPSARDLHLVLVAKLQRGNLVLDNINRDMVRFDETGYTMLSYLDPVKGKWFAVTPRV